MRHRIYLGYAVFVLLLLGVSEYRGWSYQRITEVKNVPKSVRDNPGAYRAIYRAMPHYIGGK
jgi:hypothetical protein